MTDATSSENGLAPDYYQYLLSGGTGLSGKVSDSRISGVSSTAPYTTLRPGPFQLTGPNFPYDSYAASRYTAITRCDSRRIAT